MDTKWLGYLTAGAWIPGGNLLAGKLFTPLGSLKSGERKTEYGLSEKVYAYRGKEPLSVGTETLQRGDLMMWLDLPRVYKPESEGNRVLDYDRTLELQKLIIEEQLKRQDGPLSDSRIKVIAVRSLADNLSNKKNRTKAQSIFDDKDTLVDTYKGEEILLLTKDEFNDLLYKEDEVFAQLIDALGDPSIKQFYELMEKSRGGEEFERARGLLRRSLTCYLERELSLDFNGPEVRYSLRGGSTKEKMHRMVELLDHATYGRQFRQVNMTTGSIELRSVSDLLMLDEVDLDTLTTEIRHGHNRAKISALLLDILDERTKIKGAEKGEDDEKKPLVEFIKELQDAGYQVRAQPTQEISRVRTFTRHIKGLLRRPIYPLSTFLIAWGLMHGPNLTKYADYLFSDGTGPTRTTELSPSMSGFKTGRSNAPIQAWSIAASDDRKMGGYYITETTSEFKHGSWQMERRTKEEIPVIQLKDFTHGNSYPSRPLPRGSDEIFMLRNFTLAPLATVEFKVPIKEGYTIANIFVQNLQGSRVNSRAFKLIDGTVLVKISGTSPLFTQAYIYANLSPNKEAGVKAVAPIFLEGVDDKDILSERLELAAEVGITSSTGTGEIFRKVRESKLYSVTDPTGGKLVNEHDIEERFRTEKGMSTCDCDVCNEQALISNTIVHPDSKVNMALGYMAGVGVARNTQVSDRNPWVDFEDGHYTMVGSLRDDTYHGFAVNDRGEVLDATATKMADDPATKAYIEQLSRPSTGDPLSRPDYLDALNSLIAAGGLLSGTIMARRMRKMMRDRDIHVNPKETMRGIIDTSVPQGQMRNAYRFLSALSHSSTGIDNVSVPKGRITLDRLRDNSTADKLRAYLDSPKHYEKRSGLDRIDAGIARFLATMILRGF